MRIVEVTDADQSSATRLAAVADFLIGRSDDKNAAKTISTQSFISLANNMGISLTHEQLIDLSQQPPLSNLIKNVTPEKVEFRGSDDTASELGDVEKQKEKSKDIVDKMARRAASKGV